MPARYTVPMPVRQSLPLLWLLSDARNDDRLEDALEALPPGSGFVFRHYHLEGEAWARRFRGLLAAARSAGHVALISGDAVTATALDADGIYGPPDRIASADGMMKLATAHDGAELAAAGRAEADGVFLSPVFPTRSHPDVQALGIHGFHVLAQQSPVPVIALGGMTRARAEELHWPRWGAIDGLVSPHLA